MSTAAVYLTAAADHCAFGLLAVVGHGRSACSFLLGSARMPGRARGGGKEDCCSTVIDTATSGRKSKIGLTKGVVEYVCVRCSRAGVRCRVLTNQRMVGVRESKGLNGRPHAHDPPGKTNAEDGGNYG